MKFRVRVGATDQRLLEVEVEVAVRVGDRQADLADHILHCVGLIDEDCGCPAERNGGKTDLHVVATAEHTVLNECSDRLELRRVLGREHVIRAHMDNAGLTRNQDSIEGKPEALESIKAQGRRSAGLSDGNYVGGHAAGIEVCHPVCPVRKRRHPEGVETRRC